MLTGTKKSVAVVIIGGPEFRTPDFFTLFNEKLSLLYSPEKYRITIGLDVQNQYRLYWDEKGFLTDQQPTKGDLLAFAQKSTYDFVHYFIITAREDNWGQVKRVRTNIDVNEILVNSQEQIILSNLVGTDQGDSKGSLQRARKECLGRVLDYLIAAIKL